jgi:hypothetical protein
MEYQLKTIAKSGIEEVLAKAQLYRFLNEPEESESICQDIPAADPGNQAALRLLGLAITDQFHGAASDRYAQAESAFTALTDPYEREYYFGIVCERRAKAQAGVGRPSHIWVHLFEEAMKHFAAAKAIKPANNEEAILRWNRCVRLLQTIPAAVRDESSELADDRSAAVRPHDSQVSALKRRRWAPVCSPARRDCGQTRHTRLDSALLRFFALRTSCSVTARQRNRDD